MSNHQPYKPVRTDFTQAFIEIIRRNPDAFPTLGEMSIGEPVVSDRILFGPDEDRDYNWCQIFRHQFTRDQETAFFNFVRMIEMCASAGLRDLEEFDAGPFGTMHRALAGGCRDLNCKPRECEIRFQQGRLPSLVHPPNSGRDDLWEFEATVTFTRKQVVPDVVA